MGRVALVGILFLGVCTAGVAAEPNDVGARVAAQLAAGEFAPAVEAAMAVQSIERRDDLLAQIAAAQAGVGAAGASLETVARISDADARTRALAGMGRAPIGQAGGGSMADFDSLMQLITSTIQPESWEDVGGPGSVAPFATGVYIDPQGTLQRLEFDQADARLTRLRAGRVRRLGGDAARSSALRMVSLPRLEKQLQLCAVANRGTTETMEMLAGLRRIEYVFVYPDTGDLVLAGPAGDWQQADENRIVSTETGEPIVRLDDLVVVLRAMTTGRDMRFGCLIVPTQRGLEQFKAFAEESSKTPLQRGTRNMWLAQLRGKLGKQDLEVYGIDPRTRVAGVMLEADYRMKLVGMGLEPGVPGVESYLDMARRSPEAAGGMAVLRWWFTLNYDAVAATGDRDAFALRGPGAKVLSENELLEADGNRIHTGKSDDLNRQFAASFSQHFEDLCTVYPIYAELRNICDLALACALIREESLDEAAGWTMPYLGNPQGYAVRLGPMPRQVDSVVNHRTVGRGELIVGVSGGVRVDPNYLVQPSSIAADRDGKLASRREAVDLPDPTGDAWWWD